MRIQPSISLSYVTGEVKMKYPNGYEETQKDDSTVFGLNLAFAFDSYIKNIIVITPRVSVSQSTTSFGVEVGYVFASN